MILRKTKTLTTSGFTLLEVLTAVLIIGILSTITAVNWTQFVNRRQITSISERAFLVMRQAQNEAIQRRLNRTIEFRTNSGQIQYGIYSQGQTFVWESIGEGAFHSESDFNKITFDFQGNVQFPTYSDTLPTLAFTDDRNRYLSCVQVRTLLGAMSIEQNELCIP